MIKVIELFAGVGGFRLGLDNAKGFKTIWANQWEPNKTNQFAYECYKRNFGEKEITNLDIDKVDVSDIPDHDMLVGGFPCQDYSVAQTKAKGIQGKKGVLWWNISKIVESKKPKFILLENVDRLLKSPASQRGRDFGIMLYDLQSKGYDVEWRVVNAAEYGMVQRRRRIFIFAWKNKVDLELSRKTLESSSLFSKAFPVTSELDSKYKDATLDMSNFKDLVDVSDNFNFNFLNSGIMLSSKIYTSKVYPKFKGKQLVLKDILEKESNNFEFLTKEQEDKARYLKGSKSIDRVAKATGHVYKYSEGAMSFPDDLNKPGRTMLTSESTINRSSHFISQDTKYRKITPIEAERLNCFPDNWTEGMTSRQRFFTMGNALVVEIVTKLGKEIKKW